jgi:membrane fusion protein (multidrug efflux system)
MNDYEVTMQAQQNQGQTAPCSDSLSQQENQNREAAPNRQREQGQPDGKNAPDNQTAAGVTAPNKLRRRWLKPLLLGLGLILLVGGSVWGVNYWRYSQTHVSTDDAYITGNLVNVSPIISGTLNLLTVDEGADVRRGQLLARLDDAGPLATVRQEQANYHAALTQIPQAERNLRYQILSTDAAIRKAQASLAVQGAKTSGAQQQVILASGTTSHQVLQAQSQVEAVRAQLQQALAQASAARANVTNSQQAVQTALASLQNSLQQVQTAQFTVQTAQAQVYAAQADVERTAKDEARYRVLYAEDAISAQQYDSTHNQARDALASLQARQSQVQVAQSQMEQSRASVRQAQSQVEQMRTAVTQAQAQAEAARRAADAAQEQINVARAGLSVAQANRTQVGVQTANLLSTARETGEYAADVASARAGEEQVGVRRKQVETYRAQAQQALATLTNARVNLNYTYIYAPNDGTVVKKTQNVGAALSPGQSIFIMTEGNYVWVEANFKETQLAHVRVGQPAEIVVDAFPGKVFRGWVHSINEASGAATSLLPPDNATGNFTKVVQRIPVRIELVTAEASDDPKYATARDLRTLRQGMSVTATIDTSGKMKSRALVAGR